MQVKIPRKHTIQASSSVFCIRIMHPLREVKKNTTNKKRKFSDTSIIVVGHLFELRPNPHPFHHVPLLAFPLPLLPLHYHLHVFPFLLRLLKIRSISCDQVLSVPETNFAALTYLRATSHGLVLFSVAFVPEKEIITIQKPEKKINERKGR